ncbi:hypothetical protein [uncultured Lactobacillus sp.]|uniref:hypothetical protein n=1 Tax=uncultured Lactobacillus sp. TaxID=153152 RepID=UPI00262F7F68|nr:hypothetical protein [uncultured Lactobacillus sp.]
MKKIFSIGVLEILTIINVIFLVISFKVKVPDKSNIGDTATWFGCLIAIVTVSITYWQLVLSKKHDAPEIIVSDEITKSIVDFNKTNSEDLKENSDLKFKVVNIGKGAAKKVVAKIDNKNYWAKELEKIGYDDCSFDDKTIYIGLKDARNHIKTIGSYFAEIDSYIGSDRSTYLYIPSFYISMLRNYVYDNFKDSGVTEENSDSLFQKIRSFPKLHLNLSYEGIDNEKKYLNLTIRPFADVMEDEKNSKLIYLEFEIIDSSENKKVSNRVNKITNFFKNNAFLLKILLISGCLSSIGTSLYCLFHKYVQYKFCTNEDIYYAYQHIDIKHWNQGGAFLVWGLGLVLLYFGIKSMMKIESTKKLEVKQRSHALIVYLGLTFVISIFLIALPIDLIFDNYGIGTALEVFAVLWWIWYTILLVFYSILRWLKKDGRNKPRTAIVAGLIGALIGALFGK